MTVVGMVALPSLPPEQLPDVARAVEDAGVAELWLWEDCFWAGGIAAAGTVLAATRRLRVGIGVLPVPLRAVSLTAMELAALERIAPGRVVAGLGHGVQGWMEQAGVRVPSPLTLLREHVLALRALLGGEEVTTTGRYVRLDRVRLEWPPQAPLALHVGTEGDRSLLLSGEVADGTILPGGTTPDRVRRVRELIDEGRAAAGRTGPHRLTVYRAVARPDGPAAAAAAVDELAGAGADAVILLDADGAEVPRGFAELVAGATSLLVP